MTTEELKQNFDMLGDSEEKLSYVIDLGKQLPQFPADRRTDENKIAGCSANVWFSFEMVSDKYIFSFESDALIVKGLLYIMGIIFNNRTLSEIKSIDAMGIFAELGLKSILSNQRQTGLYSIITKIQSLN